MTEPPITKMQALAYFVAVAAAIAGLAYVMRWALA